MTDEMLEIDAQDTRHMFWEEMKRIFFAIREVKPDDLDDETMDEFAIAIDQISSVLYRIEKRRREREELSQNLSAKDVSFRI
jgi:competence protein ComGF